MIVATKPLSQTLTFADFIQQLPDEEGKYELVNGKIMRILATRKHEDVAYFITYTFQDEVKRLNLNYRISSRIVIRTLTNTGIEQGLLNTYQEQNKIISPTFPELNLTVSQIINC